MLGVLKVTNKDIDFKEGNVLELRFLGDYREVFVDSKLSAIKENSSIFTIQVYDTKEYKRLQYVLIGVVTKVKTYQVFNNFTVSMHLMFNIISDNPYQDTFKLEMQFGKRFKYKSLLAIRVDTTKSMTELLSLLRTRYRTILDEDGKVYYITTLFDVNYRYNLAGTKTPTTGYLRGGAIAIYSEKELAPDSEVFELDYILHNMTGIIF